MVSILPAYFESVSDEDERVSVTMHEDLNLCQESFTSIFELLLCNCYFRVTEKV